LILKIKRKEKK